MNRRDRVVFGTYGVLMLVGGAALAFGDAYPLPWPTVGGWLIPLGAVLVPTALRPSLARAGRHDRPVHLTPAEPATADLAHPILTPVA